MKKIILVTVFLLGFWSANLLAQAIKVELTIPNLNVQPYHRPYIAVWLETPKRKGLHTLAIWHEKKDWLKDVRQWWRKLGRRNKDAYQAVTGATRRPGKYIIHWDTKDKQQHPFPAGEYFLCVETAREAGGRFFYRQPIQLGSVNELTYKIKDDIELTDVNISISP